VLVGGEDLEIASGVRATDLENETPSFEITDLGPKGLPLLDPGELVETRPWQFTSDPTVTGGRISDWPSGRGDRNEDAGVDGSSFGVGDEGARCMTESVRVEVGQASEILPLTARICYARVAF
jgi:hypothetical protein